MIRHRLPSIHRMPLRAVALAAALVAPTGCALEPDGEAIDELTESAEPIVNEVAADVGQVGVAAINNLTLVSAESDLSSAWWRNVTAYCGAPKRLLGMGSSQPNDGSILFRGLIPVQGNAPLPVGTKAAAQEDLAGSPAPWSMTAHAICASPPSGLAVVDGGSGYNSMPTWDYTVRCPGGTRVIGAGGTIWQGEGRVKIDEIRPNETLDQVTVTASEDADGTSESWSVRAYAVCASPPPGLVRVRTAIPNGWNAVVRASCPAEKVLLGLGGGVDASDARNLRVFTMAPDLGLREATVVLGRKGSTAGVTGEARAYAICADG